MVADPAGYVWSSYQCHAFDKKVEMWTPHSEYLKISGMKEQRLENYRGLFANKIEGDLLAGIRLSANRGLALGSDKFKDEIETLGNRRQRLLTRGPKAKE